GRSHPTPPREWRMRFSRRQSVQRLRGSSRRLPPLPAPGSRRWFHCQPHVVDGGPRQHLPNRLQLPRGLQSAHAVSIEAIAAVLPEPPCLPSSGLPAAPTRPLGHLSIAGPAPPSAAVPSDRCATGSPSAGNL